MTKAFWMILVLACCAFAQTGGQGMLGVGPRPGHVQVFAGIYECNMTGDATPATIVNVDCVDNNGIHTKQALTVSTTPTFSIAAPPKHACDSTWHFSPCAPADEIHFTVQPSGAWTLSAATADSGVTLHAKGAM